jgi:membrane protein DedA with SNARE-associated domain
MHVDAWLQSIPSVWVYMLVGIVVGLESLGIPLPGEVVLVSSALLSAKGVVDPVLLGVCASAGAILGDSIGYLIGRKGGRPLFDRLGRRFPRHCGPEHIAKAEQLFSRWGMWAVFFGRFVALLRILSGPLAGALHMPYWKFLVANVLGGVLWAGGTAGVVYYLGLVADRWLKNASWVGLAAAVLFGIGTTFWLKRKAARAVVAEPAEAAESVNAR